MLERVQQSKDYTKFVRFLYYLNITRSQNDEWFRANLYMKSNIKDVEAIAHKSSTRSSHKKKKYASNRPDTQQQSSLLASAWSLANAWSNKTAHDFDIPYLGITSCTQSPTANRRQTMASQTFAVLTHLLRVFEEFYHVWLRAKYINSSIVWSSANRTKFIGT